MSLVVVAIALLSTGGRTAHAGPEPAAAVPDYARVLPLSGIERFDGRAGAAAINRATWLQLYDELRRASADPAGRPSVVALHERASDGARRGVVPLAIVDERYRGLDSSADAPAARAERRAFAVTPLVDHTWRGGRTVFRLDRADFFSHDPAPALEADFDDGRGWRELHFATDCVVGYQRPGLKTLRVRAHATDGVREASAGFRVAGVTSPSPDDTLEVTAATPYLGQFGTGKAYVYRSAAHATLVNPVIVIEGFDLDNSMGWDELYQLLNQENLLETLRADGFDAVVLDFTDATDYVQKNAFVLEALIQQVEAAIDPGATIAVVGASMGGLVGRYALAHLEATAVPHRVRTFVSFDAPHAGANIPLGIQYWVGFFAPQSADAAFLLDRLDRPASRQMLVYHYTTPPGATGESDPLRAGLAADLAAVGDYPEAPRLVAVANGSAQAAGQGFAPGDAIVQWHYSNILATIVGDVWAVPQGTSHVIFDGRLRILLSDTRQTVTVGGTLPFDNAPGGSRATMSDMDAVAAPFGDIVALHGSHCFIPTISSLALTTADLFYDVAADPDLLAHTPFDAVYAPAANQEHVAITPENAAWFRTEVEAGVTGVGEPTALASLTLSPAAPNPFSAASRIGFSLAAPGRVEVAVFDVDGRRVRTLVDATLGAGSHEARWDGADASGRAVGAGVYFVRLAAAGQAVSRRLVRLGAAR
jgi:hypothetical protein